VLFRLQVIFVATQNKAIVYLERRLLFAISCHYIR